MNSTPQVESTSFITSASNPRNKIGQFRIDTNQKEKRTQFLDTYLDLLRQIRLNESVNPLPSSGEKYGTKVNLDVLLDVLDGSRIADLEP